MGLRSKRRCATPAQLEASLEKGETSKMHIVLVVQYMLMVNRNKLKTSYYMSMVWDGINRYYFI